MKKGNYDNWIVASSKIISKIRYAIHDLEPSTSYEMKIVAYSKAGNTAIDYHMETLNLENGNRCLKYDG